MYHWNKAITWQNFPKLMPNQPHFPRNMDIYGFMDKKRIFKNNLKIMCFSPKYSYLWSNGRKTAISKWSQETWFSSKCWYSWILGQTTIFSKLSQKLPFPRNIDIFGQILKYILMFLEVWAKNDFQKWSQKN